MPDKKGMKTDFCILLGLAMVGGGLFLLSGNAGWSLLADGSIITIIGVIGSMR